MIDSAARWFAAMLCIAGLTHIYAVLQIPSHVHDRTFVGTDVSESPGSLVRVDGRHAVADFDPTFLNAVCRFDEDTGPVRLIGAMPTGYWSIAAMADDGRILSTLSREDVSGPTLDLLVGKTAAIDAARQGADIDTVESMSLPVDTGYLLVRLFAGSLGDRDGAETSFAGLSCQPAVAQ